MAKSFKLLDFIWLKVLSSNNIKEYRGREEKVYRE